MYWYEFLFRKFPSPYGVSFILILNTLVVILIPPFPSPYGVSFILMRKQNTFLNVIMAVRFPSPYGVSFILMWISFWLDSETAELKFPSPYGVSFILIFEYIHPLDIDCFDVSVSLRSIIHSYSRIAGTQYTCYHWKFPSPYGVSFILILWCRTTDKSCIGRKVSVSLRSIIHSYALGRLKWLNSKMVL